MSKVRRLRELSGRDRWLLLQALCMVPLARLSLALSGFNRTDQLFQRLAPMRARTVDAREAEPRALATARMVRIAALNGVCRATCLPRSIVVSALLRRQGMTPTLCLGARRRDGVLEAHAWVTVNALKLDHDTADDGQPFSPFAAGHPLDEHDNATC